MENIAVEGRLVQIMDPQSGNSTRGSWKKQDFILETQEQYPKKICICCWNEKTDELARYKPNDQLKVSINIESREYNSRWYTDIKAWRIEPLGAGESAGAPPASAPASTATKADEDDVIGMSFSSDDDDDTLPF